LKLYYIEEQKTRTHAMGSFNPCFIS